jgi:hypothetical protein
VFPDNSNAPTAPAAATNVSDYYRSFVPRRVGDRWEPQPGVRSEALPKYYASNLDGCPIAAGDPGFKRICNVEAGPCAAATPEPTALYDGLPGFTSSGERVQDAIQRSLRLAWGPDPPQIDLYFRAGCGAVAEMAYLLPTIELFWPEFLGEVIIALDAGNNASLESFLPHNWRTTKQSYRLVYEDVPCLPPRIFNQVSYLNLDMHSRAQYIVTIDSDCVLHTPVTPDLLFDERGLLYLAFSFNFQGNMWRNEAEFFTGRGSYKSHTMVTQPVSFARGSFEAFRKWMREKGGNGGSPRVNTGSKRGECYLDSVTRFFDEAGLQQREAEVRHGTHWFWNLLPGAASLVFGAPHIEIVFFCWMCQLGTFLQIAGDSRALYHFVNLDSVDRAPLQRIAIHVTYELAPISSTIKDAYAQTAHMIVHEGICRAMGAALPGCEGIDRVFVDFSSFSYHSWPWSHINNKNVLEMRVAQFQAAERSGR